MTKRITDTWLRSTCTKREVRSEPGGLTARKGPRGASFFFRYMLDGEPKWVSLGAYKRSAADRDGLTLAQARAEAAKGRVQVSEARAGRAIAPAAERRAEKTQARIDRLTDPTVADFASLYIERHAKVHKKSWHEDERILRVDVLPFIGGLKFAELERAHFVAMIDRKVDAGRPLQAGNVLKVLRRMEHFAIERGQIGASRVVGIKPPAKSPPRRRVLVSDKGDEISGLFRALQASQMHPGMKLAIELQLLTGQRSGAVHNAQWSEIDFERGVWTIPPERMKRTKRSHWADLAHVVPLSQQALDVLEQARALSGDSPYVFPGRDAHRPWALWSINQEIHRETMLAHLREQDVERFNLHDLRRTATTLMASLGIAPHVIDRVLGHVPHGVTGEHYDRHSYGAEMRDALDKLGARVAALKAGKPAKIVPMARRR